MSEKISLTLRMYLVLVIILGAVSAQYWAPTILGRPIHFIWTALKRK